MNIFRDNLDKIYNSKCIISDYKTSQKNHIIPRFFCKYHKKYANLEYCPNNGLILTDTLHREYDNYIFSFDIYQFKYCDKQGNTNKDIEYVEIPIIVASNYQKGNYMINDLIHNKNIKSVIVKASSISYLWVAYQVFLSKNYLLINNIKDEYLKYIEHPLFEMLFNVFDPVNPNPDFIIKINEYLNNSAFQGSVIMKSRNYGGEVLILDRFKPFDFKEWQMIDNVNKELIEDYQSNIEVKFDKTWKP
tara:strand:- start:5231 stop:5971 length:741 start_codon:yes stop_codon:yes gene_type:complete